MPHEIHTSERRSYRGCKRRWDWAYREGYTPHTTAKPLEFGIAFHEALAEFFEPTRWESATTHEKLQFAIAKFIEICEQQRDAYLDITNQRELDIANGDDYADRVELGIGMLTHYANEVHPRGDSWFKPIATEIPFEVPLYDLKTGEPLVCTNSPQCGQIHSNTGDDSNVIYAGRIDMLVEDIRYGGYYVWDHKSAAQLAANEEFLQLDDQVGSYVWATKRVLNLDVKGFVYAEYRKAYPAPPKLLSRQMKGKSFSVDKNQPTTLEIFTSHVKQFDTDAYNDGCYTEYILYLSGPEAPQFQKRFIIMKTDAELDNIGRNITMEATEMIQKDLLIYPSVGRFGCGNCAYKQPCIAAFRDEDVLFTLGSLFKKVEHRYYHDKPTDREAESTPVG